jgi:hypothetical protein
MNAEDAEKSLPSAPTNKGKNRSSDSGFPMLCMRRGGGGQSWNSYRLVRPERGTCEGTLCTLPLVASRTSPWSTLRSSPPCRGRGFPIRKCRATKRALAQVPCQKRESFRTPREEARARTQFVRVQGTVCKGLCNIQRHEDGISPALDLLFRVVALEDISIAERARLGDRVIGDKGTVVVLPTLGDAAEGMGFRV